MLTKEDRLRLELEFPELAAAAAHLMPPDLANSWHFTTSWTCEQMLPVTQQEFAGQNVTDMLKLYELYPDFETVMTAEMLGMEGKVRPRADAR